MSFPEDIAVQLNAVGVGVWPGTRSTRTIYIGEMPDSPDACICLYGEPGRPKDMRISLQYPDLKIQTRAATYNAAQAKAEAVDAALHGQHDVTWSGHRYIMIRALGSPWMLEIDKRNRITFTQRFSIQRSP